jgi:metal transporter CNNM
MAYLISLVLVLLSGLFSGLTLGLLSLDTQTLKRRAKHGDPEAKAIYPVRRRGNLLLTTLLLGNVAVNTTLSIFLGTIASGIMAGIMATTLIVLFGEIIPQAVISRYALWFGAKTLWFTKLAIFIAYPIARPIAMVLDYFLGNELPTTYSNKELMDIISEHENSEHSSIDQDEERIMHGALQFSHMRVKEVMSPAESVVMFDMNQRLSPEFYAEVNRSGYSRIPVFSGNRNNVVGILYVKDLLIEQDGISLHETKEAFDGEFLQIRGTDLLDVVLGKMLKRRQHLAIVKNRNNQFLGVITLEDVIEEIIQQEIEDEDDEDETLEPLV